MVTRCYKICNLLLNSSVSSVICVRINLTFISRQSELKWLSGIYSPGMVGMGQTVLYQKWDFLSPTLINNHCFTI